MTGDHENGVSYQVVVNDEGQYSIWPLDRPLPLGWYAGEVSGSKETCLAHIGEVWTDMRPLSLRRHMEGEKAAGDG